MSELDRRRFLKALGLGAAALGLRSSLGPSSASADSHIPQRIIFFYDEVGMVRGGEFPRPIGGAAWPTETEWDLAPLMQPLAPWKDRMSCIAGVDMVSASRDPIAAANAHVDGMTSALTGAFRRDADVAGGVSINQYIAYQLNSPMPVTRLPSVEVGVQEWGELNNAGTYDMGLAPVPFLVQPPQVYARLFPEELRLSGEEAILATRRRMAVGDLVRGEADRLIARLSTEQRLKIEQHRDSHVDLQRRLGLGGARLGNIPDGSITNDWGSVNWRYDASPSEKGAIWQTMGRLNTQMVAAALHADITRVATVHVGHAPGDLWGYSNGAYGTDDWHDFVHRLSGDTPDISDPTAAAMIGNMHLRSTNLLASLLTELESRLEPDGQTLLDHTLVVFCSALAEGSHDLTRVPWSYVGDAHGYLRTGRAFTFDRPYNNPAHGLYGTTPPPGDWSRYNQEGPPHNNFFVTLANAMGIETDTFGEASVCTGGLSELVV